jgi:transcriptional regulator with XRE-family HTH domain
VPTVSDFAELLGQRMRAAREGAGVTLDGVARAANRRGLTTWRRNTVGELEKGRRRLTVEEFVALPVILDDAGCRTLQPDGPALILADDEVQLVEGWVVPGSAFLALAVQTREPELAEVFGALREDEPTEGDLADGRRALDAAMRLPAADPAELKAAESLRKADGLAGLTPVDVQLAAERLWGRRIAEERDRRLMAEESRRESEGLAAASTSPRGRQALRGHITRALLDELAQELTTDKGRRVRHG